MSNDSTDRFAALELDLPSSTPRVIVPMPTPEPATLLSSDDVLTGDGISNRDYNNRIGATTIEQVRASVPELACKVEALPLCLDTGERVPNHRATVRIWPDGRKQALGVVGDRYRVVQDQRMLDISEILLKRGAISTLNAGSYKARTWVYGERTGASAEITRGDVVTSRFLLGNSHDGSIPFLAGTPSHAVVCQNTMLAAVKSKLSKFLRLRHSGDVLAAVDQLEGALIEHGETFLANMEQARAMVRVRVDEAKLREYTGFVFSRWADTSEDEESTAGDRVYNQILENFHGGRGMAEIEGRRGTAWGAYNAVTEYLTHQRGRGDANDTSRFDAAMFGAARALHEKAWSGAVSML